MADNETIVRDFIAAWSKLDVSQLVNYFSPDGIYHNMPMQPISGHENLTNFIAAFLSNWDSTDWEVINLLADGDMVMVERIDRTVVGGKSVELPCFGCFELRDGKISVWRDYFDMATYTKAVT